MLIFGNKEFVLRLVLGFLQEPFLVFSCFLFVMDFYLHAGLHLILVCFVVC